VQQIVVVLVAATIVSYFFAQCLCDEDSTKLVNTSNLFVLKMWEYCWDPWLCRSFTHFVRHTGPCDMDCDGSWGCDQ
jgi:hypothetical protein